MFEKMSKKELEREREKVLDQIAAKERMKQLFLRNIAADKKEYERNLKLPAKMDSRPERILQAMELEVATPALDAHAWLPEKRQDSHEGSVAHLRKGYYHPRNSAGVVFDRKYDRAGPLPDVSDRVSLVFFDHGEGRIISREEAFTVIARLIEK
jgi:hypothetical protein